VLHHGRSRKAIVRVIPDGQLFRIEWPDLGLSDLTNLTRAKQAALEWAERQLLTEGRKNSVARRLKSLDNFWWSAAPVRQKHSDEGWTPWPAEADAAREAES